MRKLLSRTRAAVDDYKMIENGDKQPNFETIWKLAVALDMKPSEFIAIVEKEILDKQ